MQFYIVLGFIGYLIGSIPFGLVFTRLAGMGDIRQIGSKNIGATNVLRTGRKDLALLTLLCDALKAGITAFFASMLASENKEFAGLLAGSMAIIGHNFPVWLKFKGGKGVASTFGFMLFTVPWTGVLACLTWLATAIIFRYSSLAAIVAMISAPFYTYIFYNIETTGFFIAICALCLIRHKTNFQRLFSGQETKIGQKKKEESNK